MSTLTSWRAQAACASVDPDLFFPERNTPAERIAEAKQICEACPVKQLCLEDAFRRNEPDAICGGMTGQERENSLRPASVVQSLAGRRPGKTSARQMAVKHGAYLLLCLVQHHMSVQEVARQLGSTPTAVYGAFVMLVPAPAGYKRPTRPSVIGKLVAESKERLKTLERRGISHAEIGVVLGVPQSVVSAALAVLRQREDALERLAADGVAEPMARLQEEEIRVRVESGASLTVDDVIKVAGRTILRMSGEGMPLRQVARELEINRETVRLAYQQMTTKTLTKNEMGEAA
ncbi:WhiB family transcriptional regulator [Streptomyces sp. NPDC046862]|uniref:WhiB family transcriptional regulator n=1 Tax=Streptomyces sp. NPDC046862 TaxID=3154603 RepID=UPI0034541905